MLALASGRHCWHGRHDTTPGRRLRGSRVRELQAARGQHGIGLRTKLALARTIWGADLPDAAINYVWDNRNPIGTERPNVYTDRAIMVALRSGDKQAGGWIQERHDVRDDVSRLFSHEAQPVQLAVTADTDNTGLSAHAGFADFHFVGADAECQFPPARP